MGTRTTVIVPTQSAERTARLLASLAPAAGDYETLIVDNGTDDREFEELTKRWPGVRILRLAANEGFSRAVNRAVSLSEGDRLVLLNDDCICGPGFIEALAGGLDPAAGTVMAAAVLRDWRNPNLIDSAGMELDHTLLALDYLNGEPVSCLEGEIADPIGPSAAAAAFDRDAFERAGGFDEGLFAYWEDVDLVIRLRLAGGRCRLVRDAVGTHQHSATLGAGSAEKNRLMGYGRGFVLRRWGVLRPRRAPAVLAREAAICAGQIVFDRNATGVAARIRGFKDGGPSRPYPAAVVAAGPSRRLGSGLTRRLRRRLRIRADRRSSGPRRVLAIMHLAEVSGPSRSLERELTWLSSEGPVEVLIPGPGPLEEQWRRIGEIRPAGYLTLTAPAGPLGALRALRAIAAQARAVRRSLRGSRPDLVLVSSALLPGALLAARLSGVPVLLYAGEILDEPRLDRAGRRRAGRALVRLGSRSASAVVACSKRAADQYERRGAPRVRVIYPPVDDRYADGDGPAFRDAHSIGQDARMVLAVGSITEGRGQDVLIRAMVEVRKQFPEAICVIAGAPHPRLVDRDFLAEISDLAAAVLPMDSVRLAGHLERTEDAYAAADLVVNPARYEAFGRVAFEAMQAGCPVVSTHVGGAAELLGDGREALLVPPADQSALADAISRVLSDPELAKRLAENGATVVRDRLDPGRALASFQQAVTEIA